MKRYSGGCHCGRVRFAVRSDQTSVYDCNCSVCTKKGYLHLIVPPQAFELDDPQAPLTEYRFNTGVAVHRFCPTCGISPFYTPRSHPDQIDVNARCLDGYQDGLFEIVPFDGRNWEANVDQVR